MTDCFVGVKLTAKRQTVVPAIWTLGRVRFWPISVRVSEGIASVSMCNFKRMVSVMQNRCVSVKCRIRTFNDCWLTHRGERLAKGTGQTQKVCVNHERIKPESDVCDIWRMGRDVTSVLRHLMCVRDVLYWNKGRFHPSSSLLLDLFILATTKLPAAGCHISCFISTEPPCQLPILWTDSDITVLISDLYLSFL